MKRKSFILIAEILISIAAFSWLFSVLKKVWQGDAFEKYRTFWLFELDYFSVLLIFAVAIIAAPIYYLYQHIQNNRLEKEIKEALKSQKEKERHGSHGK